MSLALALYDAPPPMIFVPAGQVTSMPVDSEVPTVKSTRSTVTAPTTPGTP